MKLKNNFFLILLSIVLGAFFIFSAYAKTVPSIQTFEFTISSQLHVPKLLAAWAARFFIGLEAALGLLMLVQTFGRKKWVLKLCLALMIIFSIHLIILWVTVGNEVDCGCMGSLMAMSPAASLLKNAGLIVGLLLLMRYYKQSEEKSLDFMALIVILGLIIAPYFIFPIQKSTRLVLSNLYTDPIQAPQIDLRRGKHIISFMSLTCGHCRDAAKKIHQINLNNPSIPFYFVFPKSTNDSLQQIVFKDFMKETGDINIPYTFIDNNRFVKLLNEAGETGVPSIFWVTDSILVRKVNGEEINQKEMEAWLR